MKSMMMVADGLQINYSWSAADGYYNMSVISGFSYALFAGHSDYFFTMSMVPIIDPGEALSVNLTMEPIAPMVTDVKLMGFVKDGTGAPFLEGNLLGMSTDPSGGDMPYYVNFTTVDIATGYFEVNVLPSATGGGVALMDVPGMGMISNDTDLPFVSGNSYWINLTVSTGPSVDDCTVYGTVTDDVGTPLPGTLVVIEVEDNPYTGRYTNSTFTDALGYYEMNAVNGSARVTFSKAGHAQYFDEFDIGSGDRVEVSPALPALDGLIRGHVIDLSSAMPIPYARVFEMVPSWPSGYYSMVNTDATGYFELETFASSHPSTLVGAEADGYSRNYTPMSVAPGIDIWMDFGLWPVDAWITGTVTDYFTGAPIADAWVSVRASGFEDGTSTDAAGQYNVSVVSGFEYTIQIGAMDYMQNTSTLTPVPGANIHDVALLPWDLPQTTLLWGYVNDSITGLGLAGAEVRVSLPDNSYQNMTSTNGTGYYEMNVPPIVLRYRATAWSHGPYFDTIDLTGVVSQRMDVLLEPDVMAPSITSYSQVPADNVSWINPTTIDIVFVEENLQQMAILNLIYSHSDLSYTYFYAIAANQTSLDPWNPSSTLDYSVMGDTYTVHHVWHATTMGGWLSNATDQVYVMATPMSLYGSLDVYTLRAYYINSSMGSPVEGTAFFDASTGDFLIFSTDWGFTIDATDPTGVIMPIVIVVVVHTSTWTMSGVGMSSIGEFGVLGASFLYDPVVPSGLYETLFYVNDWSYQGAIELTNMTVDNTPPVADAGPDATGVIDAVTWFDGTASSDNVGIANYTWDFLDGGGSPVTLYGPTPSFVFDQLGDYTITLTVRDGAGHMDTDTMLLSIVPDEPPVADAGPDQTVDEDTVVTFDGTNSYDDVGIVNGTWTIIELGVNMYGPNPTYVFADPGVYTVELVVMDTIGQLSDPDTMSVTVLDATPPVADAGPDQDVSLGSVTTFDGTASYDEVGIVNFTWTLTDGGPVELYGATPTHVFSSVGVYTVTLTVTDGVGLTDTDEVVITVIDDTPPTANAGADQNVDEDTIVTFDGSGSSDNVGIVNYTWTNVDTGFTLYGVSPSYTFEDPGTYVVVLEVRDAAGHTDTDQMTVTVRDAVPPSADAGPDQSVSVGDTVTFDGSGSSDETSIASYTWTFTDGGTVTLTGVAPTYVFDTPGTYTVTLTVTDGGGNTDSDTMTVTVIDDVPPVADAGPDQEVEAGTTVSFDGSGSSDNVGIASYEWEFTDGSLVTLTGVSPDYTFDNVGEFTVTLTVTDEAGLSDTDTVVIRVLPSNEPPVANAGADITVTAGDEVQFNGTGSTDDVGIVNYTWTVLGTTMDPLYGPEPTMVFDEPGVYTVRLVVTDGDGATDEDTVTVIVEEKEVSFIQDYWWMLAALLGAVVLAVLVLLMRKPKGGTPTKPKRSEEPDEDEPEDEDEAEEPAPPEDEEL